MVTKPITIQLNPITWPMAVATTSTTTLHSPHQQPPPTITHIINPLCRDMGFVFFSEMLLFFFSFFFFFFCLDIFSCARRIRYVCGLWSGVMCFSYLCVMRQMTSQRLPIRSSMEGSFTLHELLNLKFTHGRPYNLFENIFFNFYFFWFN